MTLNSVHGLFRRLSALPPSLILLSFSTLFFLIAQELQSTFFPLFIREYAGFSIEEFSLLLMLLSIITGALAFPCGWLADKFERKNLLTSGALLALLGTWVFLNQETFIGFVAGVIIYLFGISLFLGAQAPCIADIVPERARGKALGILKVFGDFPEVTIPFVVGMLYSFHPTTPYSVSSLFLILVAITSFALPVKKRLDNGKPTVDERSIVSKDETKKPRPAGDYSAKFFSGFALIGLGSTVLHSTFAYFTVFSSGNLGGSDLAIGTSITFISLLYLSLSPLLGHFFDQSRQKLSLLLIACLSRSVFFFVLPFVSSFTYVFPLILVSALTPIIPIGSMALMMNYFSKKHLGKVFGATRTVSFVLSSAYPLIGGYIWLAFDLKYVFVFSSVLALTLSVVGVWLIKDVPVD